MTKKLLSLALTLIVALSMSVPAFAAPLKLSDETKVSYYTDYLKIADEVNQELDSYISVNPMNEFADEDWMTPTEFRNFITAIATWEIKCTDAASGTRSMTSATKTDTITVEGHTYTISIRGNFYTMLVNTRQVFDSVDSITSSSNGGTWTQTGSEFSMLDDRRTCSITVSGTLKVAGATFRNKLASAEFYCSTTGVVS